MISKSRRKHTGSVEKLQQSSFTMANGIDERASILNSNTVLHLQNLDIEDDGSLVLRKPLKIKREFPKIANTTPIKIIPLIEKYILAIYSIGGTLYVAVIDEDNVSLPITIEYTRYDTLEELEVPSTSLGYVRFYSKLNTSEKAYKAEFLNFDNVTFANLNTTTLLYGVQVSFTNSIFENRLVNASLLTDTSVYRILSVYMRSEDTSTMRFKIYAVEPENLKLSEGELALDPNLYSDSPYALRDTYKQSVPTVKGALFYSNTIKVDNRVKIGAQYTDTSTRSTPTNVLQVLPDVNKEHVEKYIKDLTSLTPRTFDIRPNPTTNVLKFVMSTGTGEIIDSLPYRAGTCFLNIPSLDIYYSQSLCWDIPENLNEKDPVLNLKSGTETYLPAIDFHKLGTVSVDFTKNITDTTTVAPYIFLSPLVIYCEVPVAIKFDNDTLSDYFTKDTKANSKGYLIPEAVYDFVRESYWKENIQLRNMLPIAIAAAINNKEIKTYPYFNDKVALESDGTVQKYLYCAVTDHSSSIYISFLNVTASYSKPTSSIKCLTLNFPKYSQENAPQISLGCTGLQLQGYAPFDVTYYSPR